jgi:hypothetical protein
MAEHALLGASSSHKWLHCPPSARLEEQFENTTSTFAEEGTAAHALAEYKLRQFLGESVEKPSSSYDSDELEEYTDIYVGLAIELIAKTREACKDAIILVEQRLNYSCYVPEGFGTGDLIIIADETLDIVDLKYGRGVAVSAEDNPQMKLYALGALTLFNPLYDIRKVRMTICQPRLENISSYEISADELLGWAERELKPKAALAFKGAGEFLPGDHCRFCRARHACRARTESHLELTKYDFKLPALLEDDEIVEIIALADKLASWATDVYAYATDKAINQDKVWPGYKLVAGRSNRKYKNEGDVINTVTAAGYTDIYKQSLIGLSDMEKLLGKKVFAELLDGLIEKPQGKATLVPESDKRQAIKINNTAEADFKEET